MNLPWHVTKHTNGGTITPKVCASRNMKRLMFCIRKLKKLRYVNEEQLCKLNCSITVLNYSHTKIVLDTVFTNYIEIGSIDLMHSVTTSAALSTFSRITLSFLRKVHWSIALGTKSWKCKPFSKYFTLWFLVRFIPQKFFYRLKIWVAHLYPMTMTQIGNSTNSGTLT